MYIPSPNLIQSLTVAQMLNRPLLLTGEPGTGKTKFADYVKGSRDYDYAELQKFYTKSISLSQDLFYDFDAIAYFASRQLTENKPITAFIYLKALGRAICNALGAEAVIVILKTANQYTSLGSEAEKKAFLAAFTRQVSPEPIKTIVLIDEIDKAPRDFPNDLLNEIDEQYKFKIKELDLEFVLPARDKILVMITSNFEKNLPDPFLRRCVYFNIVFPDRAALLAIICANYFPQYSDQIEAALLESEKQAVAGSNEGADKTNEELRQLVKRVNEILAIRSTPSIIKKPSTSEILDFFYCVKKENVLAKPIDKSNSFISTLFKRKEDLPKS
jgi:MoxR-like ATPase